MDDSDAEAPVPELSGDTLELVPRQVVQGIPELREDEEPLVRLVEELLFLQDGLEAGELRLLASREKTKKIATYTAAIKALNQTQSTEKVSLGCFRMSTSFTAESETIRWQKAGKKELP